MNKGFFALMPTVILSSVLLIVALGESYQALNSRFAALDSELKNKSWYLALSCVNEAIIEIKEEQNTILPKEIHIQNNLCSIVSIEKNGNIANIKTYAEVEERKSNFTTSVDLAKE